MRRVALVPEPPSAAKGEITDTLRMVRTVAGELHGDLVKALQDEGARHPQIVEVSRTGDAFGHA